MFSYTIYTSSCNIEQVLHSMLKHSMIYCVSEYVTKVEAVADKHEPEELNHMSAEF